MSLGRKADRPSRSLLFLGRSILADQLASFFFVQTRTEWTGRADLGLLTVLLAALVLELFHRRYSSNNPNLEVTKFVGR